MGAFSERIGDQKNINETKTLLRRYGEKIFNNNNGIQAF